MKMNKKLIFIFCTLIIFISVSYGYDGSHKRTLEMDAQDISAFKIDAGAGYLHISGNEHISHIIVHATIHIEGISSNEIDDFLHKYGTLELKKEGGKAVLKSNLNIQLSTLKKLFLNSQSGKIDLDIEVPSDILLEIHDGSGDIIIKKMNSNIICSDGSGNIDCQDIFGDVKINDGSGAIFLRNINGKIKIDDGSGFCSLENINGEIFIKDGSGDLKLKNIIHSITIDDGSGDIILDNIDGDVHILEAGSGEEIFKDIHGTIYRDE